MSQQNGIPILRRYFVKQKPKHETQKQVFDAAMKYLFLLAKIIGLWPIMQWRYVYTIFMCLSQLSAAILCFRSLLTPITPVTITKFSYFSFYVSGFLSSVLFIRLSTKWNYLMRQLEAAELNEYIDPSLEYKCNFAVAVYLGLAIVEHTMSVTMKLIRINECEDNTADAFKKFIEKNFFWLYEVNAPYTMSIGIYLTVKNFIVTIIWNYSHVFVICISFYLTSVLTQINKVILSREGQYLPASYWRKLRTDYNRASRLVRSFDDAINTIVLISFASNMYFCCLQLFYVILYGVQVKRCFEDSDDYTDYNYNWTLQRYITVAFGIYSVAFLLLRSLAVALIAARVHSSSLVIAPTLYSVPSPTFCTEIQRFIEQIHGNTVALTGLNFFYVTKEIILTIAGTLVTYELVLLQFVKE